MLSYIRDKLKTWVLGLVVILIGIPLIFLGVGDYGSNQERYAFKVDDNEVPRTVVLQEMAQFKDVLRKNYNNSIPPLYTNEFIKKITINNLIRRNIENTISKDLSLVYSDNSIINEIQNTSSFRDDSGFNPSLYKRRLFLINMSPEIYEQYIYQKGVREQLRESITNSSFITTIDKKLNITSNYAQKTGEIVSLKMSDIKNEINISLDDINNYYEQNKSSFLSNEAASFSYLRLKKSDYVNSIKISDSEIDSQYQKNLASGAYDLPNKYDINHVVFPINTNKAEVLENAKEALIDVKNGKTFDYIVNKYTVDEDTKNNNGLLSNVSISDLPDVISSSIRDMEPSQVKLITTEDNAIHLIKLLSIQTNIKKNELTVKKNIKNQLKNDKGSKQYFTVIDKIKDKLYSDKLELSEVSKNFNINLTTTPFLNKTSTYIDIPNEVITKLFSSINTNLYPPIYIDNNDILFIKKNEYQAPKQISLKDSEDAIKALLFSRKLADLTDKRANETLNYLNTSVNPKTKSFSVYKYDKKYSEEILNIINNQKIGQKFLSYKLKSGDYIFLRLDSINFDNIDNNKVIEDNFLDYIENTQSESDYNNLYITKYDEYEIDINQEFLYQ